MPDAPRSRSLYPLRGVAGQGQIWSWISFDVANQSFTLLINTVLFSVFFQNVVVRDTTRDDTLWSITTAISMGLVVLASPIAGAIGDQRGWKKEALLGTGFMCAVLTCCLALIQPGQLWLAMLLYIPANFCFAIGENFLASFLPQLAKRGNFGRVSGFSWGVAYFAALVLLAVTAGLMLLLELDSADKWRLFFVIAGVWFGLFAIPTLLFLRERPAQKAGGNTPKQSLIGEAFSRLGSTLRNIRKHRDLVVLLVATLIYCTGTYTVIFFASILAKEFGFNEVDLVVYIAVLTVAGIVGTLVPTMLQDRLGHRKTTAALLVVWIIASGLMAVYAWQHAVWQGNGGLAAHNGVPFHTWPMWALGSLLGFGLGALGSANRAFVGFLTPASRSGEYFGLWGMVVKLAAVFTIPFALVKDSWGTPAALLVLTGFFVAGLVATLFVDEVRGARAADVEEAILVAAERAK